MKSAVVVFAREPLPGRVKTRMAATIGERAAARVYAALLHQTLEVLANSPFEVVVSFAEEPSDAWTDCRDERWEVQRGDDLGARMHDAFARRFGEGCDRVVIVGSDCPFLRGDHLSRAVEALDDVDVVLGPAHDGGYWLVAQQRPGVNLFSDVPWSTPETLAATEKRLDGLGASWVDLEVLDDVDTEDDLRNALADPKIDPGFRKRLHDALHD